MSERRISNKPASDTATEIASLPPLPQQAAGAVFTIGVPVLIEIVPLKDPSSSNRPPEVRIRKALKQMLRELGIRVQWPRSGRPSAEGGRDA
jgi:hypothetical protein